jgi:signal transduction histidine kinase
VFAGQVAMLYEEAPFSIGTTLVASFLVHLCATPYISAERNQAWLVAMWIVTLGRYVIVRWYQNVAPSAASARVWYSRFIGGVFLTGLLWGLPGASLLRSPDPMIVAMLALLIVTILGTAAMSLHAYYGAFIAFAVPLTIPSVFPMATEPAPHNLAALVVGWFTAIAVMGVRRMSSRTSASIATRLETIELARQHELAKASAERAGRAKSTFLANMSRQMRTPLNIIVSCSERLAGIAGSSEQVPGGTTDLPQIRAAGKQLIRLIGSVLELATFDVDHVEIAPSTVDLAQFADDIAASGSALAQVNRNVFTMKLDPKATSIFTDQTALRQIILNLLSNACQFTEDGRVQVDITCAAGAVCFDVSDTGAGIPSTDIPLMFGQEDEKSPSAPRGRAGLGLQTVQRLTGLLCGTLDVQSRAGEGSTFRVTIPIDIAPTAGLDPEPATAVPSQAPGIRH